MAAPLSPEGFLVYDRGETLTPGLLADLVAGDAVFRLTVDHRDVPPPLAEMDLVHLAPVPVRALPPGALVLVAEEGGFRFVRPAARVGSGRAARVIATERAGRLISLDARHRRLLGVVTARAPAFEGAWRRAAAIATLAGKVLRPFPCPVSFRSPDQLVAGIAAKYGHPADVRWQATLARGGLEEWEQKLFARVLVPETRVLVLGCGAGREVVALAQDGFRVTGVDLVPALVEEARRFSRERVLDATFVAATAPGLPLAHHAFEAVIVNYGVYEHVPTRARRVRLLREVRDLASASGTIVLGAGWMPTRGPRQALVDGVRAVLRRLLGERFTTEPGDRLVRYLSLASDGGASCFYHAFRYRGEIADEIAEAGLHGEPVEDGPWVLVARR